MTDAHTGEQFTHYPLQDGDVVIADRGCNRADDWMAMADRGVGLVIRYNPHGLKLIPFPYRLNFSKADRIKG